mgnify:CR=1 FL=1
MGEPCGHRLHRPDAVHLLATLATSGATFTSLVPTHYIMMLSLPDAVKARYDVRAVGKLLISSAPARKDTKLAILQLFPNGRLFELYGSTEAGWVTVLRPDEQIARLGSVGREWSGSGAIRLLDADGREVPDGEVGEMLVRGPSAAEGYWNQRDKSRATFEGNWTRSGDKYVRDAEGFYTYQGRTDDMFKVSGIWVSPFEVESALIGHESVLEAAVVPKEDIDGLLKPKAFIVLKPGKTAGNGLQEALKEHVKAKAGMWKYPRWIEIVEGLPKTATGKIQRFKLRESA